MKLSHAVRVGDTSANLRLFIAMIGLSLLVVAVSLFAYAFNNWKKQKFAYFAQRNVKFTEPRMLKAFLDIALRRITMVDSLSQLYNEFPEEP